MTELQQTLLRKVAARMPELKIIEWAPKTLQVVWRESGEVVTEKHLLHVAAEFEKGMSEFEHETYRTILWQLVEESDGDERMDAYDRASNRAYISATPEQRFTARLKMWGEM